MTGINLRPWREMQRQARRKRFLLGLCALLLLALVVIVLGERYINGVIDRQMARNAYISRQLMKLDERIERIDALRRQRRQLVQQMTVVHDLQGSRAGSAKVFGQLAQALPDEVFLTSVRRQERLLFIGGMAQVPGQVSTLMRNLDQAEVFDAPSLIDVKAGSSEQVPQGSAFQLSIRQESPSTMEGDQ
ncbi:type IV pilus assembly protein PilN [Pseudomonas sp. ok272]|uniref:PilN domain-containing protein n=1 Tax=unclassified Pseudomonas TaxID=196821 RepID=UPI0008B4E172|nr:MULTISPECIES: PilN domain-containing protein [unclassified Pseudomonas]SEN34411.1 type IV pilus assembly protein PilN [Pseudomonas sp. ok272]SFM84362.1 type IV pilus assembly protein PilN [Pseudomonas sp. ok602]